MRAYDYNLYQESIVRDLCSLIAVPTVNDGQPQERMPFGKNIEKGFQWVRSKAEEFGFEVTDFDGYALQLDIGTGSRVIGMLCHVDVVPAGEGWETDPFQGIIKEGNIYGRGTVDDKGPLICCMYAAKYLKENGGIPDDTRLRIIVGGDEELAWRDIAYYCRKVEPPELSFAADGMFPLVFGEKGLIDFDFSWHLKRNARSPVKLTAFKGGMARNSVPASAVFTLASNSVETLASSLSEAAKRNGIKSCIKVEKNQVHISVEGKGCHAMFPERGINAVSKAIRLLESLGEKLDCYEFIESYQRYIGEDYSGGLLGCACSDDESGALTFNLGQVSLEGDILKALLGIRYPVSAAYSEIAECIGKVADEMGCKYELIEHMAPIYFKRDDEVVVQLEKAYREVTGDTVNEPFTVGAATFARTMPNTVAFGPIFPGQEELSHLPNEFISIDDLNKCMEIYIKALNNLIHRSS